MALQHGDLVEGTLELLILKTLARESLHGYGIGQRIRASSRDVLRVREGSLYPALYRLAREGALTSEWGRTDTGRKAKFYRLTDKGEELLEAKSKAWVTLTAAVGEVLALG